MKPAVFFLAAMMASAQAQPAGVTPVWELQKQLDALVAQVRRLDPLLEQMKPEEWGVAGYREQHKSAREQVEYLSRSASALAREPEKMTLALDAFLRLDALERMLDSLSQGVRKYQNPALADLMLAAVTDNSVHRSRLQSYLTELVSTKQEELRMANDEAQSCRSAALKNPAPRRATPASGNSSKTKKP